MTQAEELQKRVEQLSKEQQSEVLNFVEFLEKKGIERENLEWTAFSLQKAMRGMEDEPKHEYTVEDVQEPI